MGTRTRAKNRVAAARKSRKPGRRPRANLAGASTAKKIRAALVSMSERGIEQLIGEKFSAETTREILDGIGAAPAEEDAPAATSYVIAEPLSTQRRLVEYFKGPEQHLALVTLLLADNDRALYTKGNEKIADKCGCTTRTVERYYAKWEADGVALRVGRREDGTAANNWRGAGYNLALRYPFATPLAAAKKNGGGGSSSNGAAGAGAGGATSGGAPLRTPTLAAAASPDELVAVLEHASIDGADSGAPDSERVTPEVAYALVVDAYRVQARERFGARAPVRKSKLATDRDAVGCSVIRLAAECGLSTARAAELVVVAFFADASGNKPRDKWPLGYLPGDVEDLVEQIKADRNAAARRRAQRDHEDRKKAPIDKELAAADVAGEDSFDFDAWIGGPPSNKKAAA